MTVAEECINARRNALWRVPLLCWQRLQSPGKYIKRRTRAA